MRRSDELLHDQSLCWIGDSMNHVSRVEMISPNCWSKPWTVDTISCRYMRFARSEEQILCGLICMSCHVMCYFFGYLCTLLQDITRYLRTWGHGMFQGSTQNHISFAGATPMLSSRRIISRQKHVVSARFFCCNVLYDVHTFFHAID